jgi:hypothetical protein
MSRKETIRPGLEIDYDLLDSDMLRWYMRTAVQWVDGPNPRLAWLEFIDRPGWVEGKETETRVMTCTLDDERELAEGRRMIRLQNYKSYACLADLARRPPEAGEFVIRKPPTLGYTCYVSQLDEAALPPGFGDPDLPEAEQPLFPVYLDPDIGKALRFSHADAIRLTIRIMEMLGYDIPGDHGDYYEPVRLGIAEELHARAIRRPRPPEQFSAMCRDISREP